MKATLVIIWLSMNTGTLVETRMPFQSFHECYRASLAVETVLEKLGREALVDCTIDRERRK